MKKIIFSIAFLFTIVFANAQSLTFQWAKDMGGSSQDNGNSIAVDVSGNVYTTGNFSSTVDFDPGAGVFDLTATSSDNVFISKLDAAGNFVWVKSIGGISGAVSIVSDAGGYIYVIGSFQNGTVDFDPGAGVFNLTTTEGADFILKLDVSGNFVWAKQFFKTAAGGIHARAISLDLFGNILITGGLSGTADFDLGPGIYNLTAAGSSGADIFILKLDYLGNFLWVKSVEGDDGWISIKAGESAVCITGSYSGTVDFDPGPGIFNLSGPASLGGNSNIFILKLDEFGNFLWAKGIGGSSGDYGYSIALDASGNVYSSGYYTGTVDFNPGSGTFNLMYSTSLFGAGVFLLKLDTYGNFVWAKSIEETSYNVSITVDAAGHVYTGGSSTTGYDVSISKLDLFGNLVWKKNMGGVDNIANFITIDRIGNVYITGGLASSGDFDPSEGVCNLASNGNWDVYVLKMSQPQNHLNGSSGIFIYPNPSTTTLTIESDDNTSISITNILGQELLNFQIQKMETIDVSFLSNGIYFVKDLNNKEVLKFIKQ